MREGERMSSSEKSIERRTLFGVPILALKVSLLFPYSASTIWTRFLNLQKDPSEPRRLFRESRAPHPDWAEEERWREKIGGFSCITKGQFSQGRFSEIPLSELRQSEY
ncbi:hypothetical protein DLM75_15820 [Leptospira stimsonii]|uniref:Uncharacterized protein n=1 Tax=Leptospira stimsonii TaxID=2202203 RepID=A0A396Z3F3_9LEPT|nr:hypothetical protein DLM75_15820 [Leptospira stimsonii]